jgi:Tol biopolymer transport system component
VKKLNRVVLVISQSYEEDPTWSPDGKYIAFTSRRDDHNQVYVMNADGSNPTNISNSNDNEYQPSWTFMGPPLPRG